MKPPVGPYMVYLLIDPRDMAPFYAGMTCRPAQRWYQHCSDRASKAYKRVAELRRLGVKCRVRILALGLDHQEARARETQAITDNRATLLNGQNRPRLASAA